MHCRSWVSGSGLIAAVAAVWFAVGSGTARAAPLPACRIVQASPAGDGANDTVLENAFLKVTVEPTSGGRLARVEYKPANVDLTCFGPYRGERPGGLFGDRVTMQNYPGDYLETSAEVKIVENTPERVRIRLKSRGQGGQAASLFIEKEFCLTRDCSSLGVVGTMTFDTGKTDPSEFVKTGLWWQHILRIGRTGSQTGFRSKYFVPLTSGILPLDFVPQGRNEFKKDDGYLRNPARGWIGTVAEPGPKTPRVGAAFTLDYSKLLHYYICMAPSMLEYPTLEWYYQPLKLRDGNSFSTRVRLVPCRGLREITGAGGGIVGELRIEGTDPAVGRTVPVHVGLVSDRTRPVTVELADRLLAWQPGKHKTTVVGTETLSLAVDEVGSTRMLLSVTSPGTHVLQVRVLDSAGKPIVSFEKPLVIGEKSGNYALGSTQPRVVVDPTIKRRANLTGPPTPHTAWAKPLRGGPVRALILTDIGAARQVVELGQRLDLQGDDVLMSGRRLVEKDTPLLWGHRNAPTRRHYDVEEHESEAERLRRLLTRNRYEVMVLTPDALRLTDVPNDVRDLTLKLVKAGMGLVCLGPSPHEPGAGWLDSVSPVTVGPGSSIPHHIYFTDDGHYRTKGLVRTASPELFRTRGFTARVPVRAFPPTAAYASERLTTTQGETLLGYDRTPVLVAGAAGKGRVAVLNAAMHNLELNTYFEDQAPAMRGETYQGYPWQEYSYLLLSKMILWAAKRDAELSLQRVSVGRADADAVELSVHVANLTGTQAVLSVELALRDPFHSIVGQPETRQTEPLAARGRSQVVFRIPGPLAAGAHTADATVRDAQGAVADFGSVTVRVPGPVSLVAVTPRRALQEQGQPATVHVVIHADEAVSGQLDWRLNDTHHRTIQAGAAPADLRPGRNVVEFTTDSILTGSRVLDLALCCRAGDRPLHRRISYLFVRQPRRLDDLMFEVYILGGGSRANRSFPFMRQLGVDAGGVNYSGYPWSAAFLAVKNNQVPLYGAQFISDFGYYGAAGALRSGPPRTWPDVKPDDPANSRVWPGITRPGSGSYGICPHHPSCLSRRAERVRTRGPTTMLYSPFDYFISDESTFQRDTYQKTKKSIDDLCFCRHCLAAFRDYLKQEYGTLEKLNAGWDAKYGEWDQAMPLPGRQARLLENWSRWIDFRIFTAKSYCGSVTAVQDLLCRIDPGSRTSGNIHWESPWTGYMSYYLHGPGGNATAEVYPRTFEQVRSYSPDPAFRRVHIGYATYPGHPRTVTDHYAWRNLGYGGGRTDFYNGIEGMYGGVLQPTYQLALMGEWLRDLDAAMRRTGIGKAILTSTPDPAVVGVVESYPSQFSYYLEPQQFDEDGYYRRGDYAMWHDIKRFWGSYGKLAEDLGLPWRLLNEEECAENVPGGMRVLFLPRATCLGERTARVLERFVREGGTVIADVRLGERDGHGRPAGNGGAAWLGDLFGVRRARTGHDTGQVKAKVQPWPEFPAGCTIATSCHDPGIQAAGAEPHGAYADGAPHTLLRRLGKGAFVYLNYELWGYSATRSPGVRALIGAILSRTGVKPAYRLFGAEGRPATNVLCLRRSRGSTHYYFLLANQHGPRTDRAELVLPGPAHLYDVGTHGYLDRRDRLPTEPSSTRGQLIAAVPYRLTGLTLSVAGRAAQGREAEVRVQLKATRGRIGDHVVRIEVTRPDGAACSYWSGNVLAEKGRYARSWRLALDEQLGTWRVCALDVLSGNTAETTFDVVPGHE